MERTKSHKGSQSRYRQEKRANSLGAMAAKSESQVGTLSLGHPRTRSVLFDGLASGSRASSSCACDPRTSKHHLRQKAARKQRNHLRQGPQETQCATACYNVAAYVSACFLHLGSGRTACRTCPLAYRPGPTWLPARQLLRTQRADKGRAVFHLEPYIWLHVIGTTKSPQEAQKHTKALPQRALSDQLTEAHARRPRYRFLRS